MRALVITGLWVGFLGQVATNNWVRVASFVLMIGCLITMLIHGPPKEGE
jgi:hypothetical protein